MNPSEWLADPVWPALYSKSNSGPLGVFPSFLWLIIVFGPNVDRFSIVLQIPNDGKWVFLALNKSYKTLIWIQPHIVLKQHFFFKILKK